MPLHRMCHVHTHRQQQPVVLLLLLYVTLLSPATYCDGFSTSTGLVYLPQHYNRRDAKKLPAAATGRTKMSTELLASSPSSMNSKMPPRDDDEERQQQLTRHQQRRDFITSLMVASASAAMITRPASASAEEVAPTLEQQQPRRIVRLSSGLQFSDARVGSGPLVQMQVPIKGNNNNDTEYDRDENNVVLLHLKALRGDGSTLFDTRKEGSPILFRLGSIQAEELYFINEGTALSKGRITLGVQDAILAQGRASWVGGYGKADAMRYGGVRMIVAPSALAYGNNGVSRYEAYKIGFKNPVARNEVLRYEIELFRCNEDTIDFTGENNKEKEKDGRKSAVAPTARACCPDEFYPCQTTPTDPNT